MKRLLIIALLLVPATAAAKPQLPTAKTIARVAASSVTVETESGRGSGTVIGQIAGSALVLTCRHVIAGSFLVTVVVEDDEYRDEYKALVIDENEKDDLALLMVSDLHDSPVLPTAKHEPALYDRLIIVGSPMGMHRIVADGMLTSKGVTSAGRLYRIQGFIMFGLSGGTITNLRGELVGVPEIVAQYHGVPVPQVGLAVPLPAIRKFLDPYINN